MRKRLTRHEWGWLFGLASAVGVLMFFWAASAYSNWNYFYGAVLIGVGLIFYHIAARQRPREA